ncbi:MAG: cobalamin B12-binding domain-containing protein, partial [Lautropia sp.]
AKKPVRFLMAKLGLDGHDRGALSICLALRDHGAEVIYTGLRQTPEAVARIAVDENVDVVGVSSLADAHRTLVPRLIDELKRRDAGDIPVLLGGFIQPEDIPELKAQGVVEVFGPGSSLDEIVRFVFATAHKARH